MIKVLMIISIKHCKFMLEMQWLVYLGRLIKIIQPIFNQWKFQMFNS